MKSHFIVIVISSSLIFMSTVYANPKAQDGAKILQDKAISYSIHSAKDTNFDIKIASRELSQNAFALGKIYSSDYTLKLNDITSETCLEEVALLKVDSNTFLNKATAGQYKSIDVVNGNLVMLIAAGAGELTYTVIDKGSYCAVEKSIHDAYWASNIIRSGIDALNIIFS